ncbi:MAG: DNA polymerase III subunit gamma/tau [Oscillospiraceae bacterium]|jgi:DNA polymerase-3 subunit gamma/tau|nr:DNA polymerase III subunit gamma/tau [Oscillospiraceae bacterium]
MYQALYRKYRSQTFSDIVGQDHITNTLQQQLINDRLSHAYLFVGTRGTGKTSCAKILSRAVNCLDLKDGNPCNVCVSCVGIEEGSILDVLELDAASNNKVDDVRALRDEAIYTPATTKKRVYIIDEVHMLTTPAFNALLKILEEPPPHILFILATTELHKVPATIQGRCQKFSFKRLSRDEIINRLKMISTKENLNLTDEAVEKLTSLADGSMRDGISLLDQCITSKEIDLQHVLDTIGLPSQQNLIRLLTAIGEKDINTALKIIDTLYDEGKDMTSLLNELSSLVRDLLIYKISPESGLINPNSDLNDLESLSKILTSEQLYKYLDSLGDAIFGLSKGNQPRLAVEMCLFRLCEKGVV